MAEDMGTIRRTGAIAVVRFERELITPPADMWRALTSPEVLERWLAEPLAFEATPGGAVHLAWGESDHATGVITVCEPPRELAYTWLQREFASEVAFSVIPLGPSDSTLVLEHRGLPLREAIELAAGWHLHLGVLQRTLAGEHTSFVDATGDWNSLRAQYSEIAHTG